MDQREWLEANGVGGYASGTVCGINTRRYHGLLVAATNPPVGRVVMLAKLDERITIGATSIDLASNQFPGAVHPRGFKHLRSFERKLFPAFEYVAEGVRIRKTVAAIHGENTTVIVYELLESPADVTLELRPFIAGRDYHSLVHANDGIHRDGTFDDGVFALQPYDGLPTLFLAVPGAAFHAAPDWYFRFEYAIELERGLEAHEDLFTPGTFSRVLAKGTTLAVVASISDPRGRDGLALFEAELRRRESIVAAAPIPGRFGRALAIAADQFIVRRGIDRKTIIAGYHWFTDWGRDTMIALPGLCLATGRFDDARTILLAFAECVSEGMLPNRFPDGGEAPEYNTVDATLWFFVAAQRYLDYTADETFVRETLLPVLRDIVAWHERGTRHNIHVDEDGLLTAGIEGDQLTWMDVKIGDWVVTPRHGKAVEINALWFNALIILSGLEERWGSAMTAQNLAAKAERARVRFREVFWNEKNGSLYDVVRGEERDASIRPNQIFAISLPHPLLDGADAEDVLRIVEQHLLTPVGLRSLSPDDPRFIGTYIGGPRERDAAYHQGTVWSWLLGPFITALVRVRGDAGVAEGQRILKAFAPHLEETCIGTISEIFDGAYPHAPRGCAAQAWSVGEILRAAVEDLGMGTNDESAIPSVIPSGRAGGGRGIS
jgi:predicted glycogen debranching enzyme